MEKLWKIIRIVLFTVLAVLIFIFPDFFTANAAFIVGSVMILFGADDLLHVHLTRKGAKLFPAGLSSVVSAFLGLFMIIFLNQTAANPEHLIKVCVIWAVWSIIQEIYELYEVYELFRTQKLGILSALESIAVIVLSVLLILDPAEHVRLHIIILGAELILKYGFTCFYQALSSLKCKRRP